MSPEKYYSSTKEERDAHNSRVLIAVAKYCHRKEKDDFVIGQDGWYAKNKTEVVKKPGQTTHPSLERTTQRGRGRTQSASRGSSNRGKSKTTNQRSKSVESNESHQKFQGKLNGTL